MNRTHIILIIHALIGAFGGNYPAFVTVWGVGATVYFLYQIIRNRNQRNEALAGAAYISSLEVWLRMGKAGLPWEFGKFAVLVLLMSGMMAEKNRRYPWRYLWMVFLLMPAILISSMQPFEQFRQDLTFQLGGVFVLIASLFYCYYRTLSREEFSSILRVALYPILAITMHLFFLTPALQEIKFTLNSNFQTSGNFGPNQVSTILGIGIFLILINYLLRLPTLFGRVVDGGLILAFLFRVLLTLSRGGFVTILITLVLTYFIYLTVEKKWSVRQGLYVLLFSLASIVTGIYVNALTGNALFGRLKGETGSTSRALEEKTLEKATSGRSEIVLTDLLIFKDYPVFGCGLGISNILRPDYGYNNISHIEQTRLLAEHGIFGLVFLLLLCFIPAAAYFRRRGHQKYFLFAFTGFAFLTMLHSATRLSLVGLYYGVGFLLVVLEANSVHRQ